MKAQRLKITENGMTTYSDYYCGIKFTDGLSDEPVSAADATRIGSFIRCEAIDDGRQTGLSNDLLDLNTAKAEVVIPLAESTPDTVSPEQVASAPASTERHTRESLEGVADSLGIQGLRSIAESYGVKGRGIVELINEILKAQG